MAQDLRLHWPLAALRGALPGVDVQAVAAVGSTNTELLERLKQGHGGPALLVAEAQLQGRGRSGRRWQSEPGRSLTFSVALPLAPADWSGLSLAVGAVLADAIEPLADGASPRLQLKWPNDLWLADGGARWRKLGGILIETVAVGAHWITSAKISADTVYAVTKALWSDKTRAALDAGHAKGKDIRKQTALNGLLGVPLHPGAERFYKEAGLLK